MTAAVKPVARFLPPQALLRLPVTRSVHVRSPLCEEGIVLQSCGVDLIASTLYWHGLAGWEPETLPVFLRLVQAGSTVLDVGANTGLFSLLAAQRAPGVRVHAVEPVPRVFQMLEDNVRSNRLQNVTCHRLALGDHEGTVSMYVPREDVPIMASLLPGWRTDSECVEVESQTLDQLVARLGLGAVDVLKIDAEGAETLVLSGARDTLSALRPFVVCEVLAAAHTAHDLTAILNRVGYRSFILGAKGPQPTDRVVGHSADGWRNHLFVHRSRMEEARALLNL